MGHMRNNKRILSNPSPPRTIQELGPLRGPEGPTIWVLRGLGLLTGEDRGPAGRPGARGALAGAALKTGSATWALETGHRQGSFFWGI